MFQIKFNKILSSRPVNKTRGFTLIEVTLAVALTSILAVIFYQFFNQSLLMQSFISEQNQAVSEAQKGVDLFIKELREAAISDTGAFPTELADEQEIIFYSDIDADSYTEKVHYFIEDSSLKKGVTEPSGTPLSYSGDENISVISANVVNQDNSVFSYYTADYPVSTTPLTYPADVSAATLVKIHLEININPDRVPDTYILESFAQLRNLKSNL
ncbi:MAG: prepilin-type N-terminal cleavage/methylation domain-containing protein [Patescibacteria group bacterium]